MKKALLSILFLFIISNVFSQKELWGYKVYYSDPDIIGINDGQIIKVPLAGNNSIAEIVHAFDITGVLGRFPQGKLFQASNGKLYGVAGYFVNAGLNAAYLLPSFPGSVLFEYDLILNKYKVIAQLNSPNAGVIEPQPGILMGTNNNGNSFYKYNINTGVFTIVATIPSFRVYGLGGNYTDYFPGAISELFKASDGNLYFTSIVAPNGPPATSIGPQPGGIYKYNLTTNSISKVYYFGQDDFSPSSIFRPYPTRFVESANGKLYNITQKGFIAYNPNFIFDDYGYGVLYEFDINTNTVTIKYEYDFYTLGAGQSQLTRVSDTKILGATYSYTGNLPNIPYRDGAIYEYDIPSNTVSLKHAINYNIDGVYNIGIGSNLASDGNYYDNSYNGVFRYNPITNVINKKIANTGDGNLQEMIEVCRKPSYQEILVNTFTPAVGSTFTYNIQNTNATTYVWKKGTTVLPAQTTGILNLPSVTPSDTGVYSCTMTNECGTTVTANLNINVTNLAVETVDDYKTQISLYPNPTKGSINLKFPENRRLKATSYKITNLLGQIIEEKDISTSGKNELTINTGSFANGVYQITLVTNKGNWNGKFVKE